MAMPVQLEVQGRVAAGSEALHAALDIGHACVTERRGAHAEGDRRDIAMRKAPGAIVPARAAA